MSQNYFNFSLYQGLSLWLEESRLHDPNLYIDDLPDAYIPELLLKVFQGEDVSKNYGSSFYRILMGAISDQTYDDWLRAALFQESWLFSFRLHGIIISTLKQFKRN